MIQQAHNQGKKNTTNNSSKNVNKKPTTEVQGSITTASETLENAVAGNAQKLVESANLSKKARIQTGVKRGRTKTQDIIIGEQLGVLDELAQHEVTQTFDLAEQLDKLSEFSNAATDVSEILEAEETDPLESLKGFEVKRLPDSNRGFSIFS
ncbi:MAG: hypothetical protein F6K54_05600 [Okeania sp. SIO3B5]|uniref:hypothetical protein n=1 Tax=Okeania sp. SIO3B5 TaxID=2607811 RepID=UPI0014019846|nr:hypothetical protein [Okeania sp. SIO3B5]NEO52594.1 hypothetical protein [Okeania sp. SIO3B5]